MKIKKANIYNITICFYIFGAVVFDTGSIEMKLTRAFLMAVWGLRMLFEKKTKLPMYSLRMIAFFLFATLTIAWAESTGYATAMSKSLFINTACMCALANLINNKRERIDMLLKALAITPLLLEARVIMIGGILGFMESRMVGPISGNTVGYCAAFGACISLYYYFKGDKRKYGFLLVVNTVIAVLSASRKALLCECIPIMLVYILNTKKSLSQRISRCLFLLMAGVAGFFLLMNIPILYELVGNRIGGLLATLTGNMEMADGSSQARSLLIIRGMQWFRERPWLGFGIDNYRVVLVSRYPDWPIDFYAHNNYVELLVDTGIIGTALYYWNYLDILIKGWRNRRMLTNTEVLFLGMLVSVLFSEIALVSYFDKYVQVLLLAIWFVMTDFYRSYDNAKTNGINRTQ